MHIMYTFPVMIAVGGWLFGTASFSIRAMDFVPELAGPQSNCRCDRLD